MVVASFAIIKFLKWAINTLIISFASNPFCSTSLIVNKEFDISLLIIWVVNFNEKEISNDDNICNTSSCFQSLLQYAWTLSNVDRESLSEPSALSAMNFSVFELTSMFSFFAIFSKCLLISLIVIFWKSNIWHLESMVGISLFFSVVASFAIIKFLKWAINTLIISEI